MKERTPSPIPMKMVESSYMEAYGYDPATRTLAVRFPPRGEDRGPLYHYDNVSPEKYEELEAAESKGSYFIHNVKRKAGDHPYKRIDESPESDS